LAHNLNTFILSIVPIRAKQWRSGDWMCSNCNNHNYASRLQCNRLLSHSNYILFLGCKLN